MSDDQRTVDAITDDMREAAQQKVSAEMAAANHYEKYEADQRRAMEAESKLRTLNRELLTLLCPEAVPPPPEPVDPALTAEPPPPEVEQPAGEQPSTAPDREQLA